jgi:hypothetical protein
MAILGTGYETYNPNNGRLFTPYSPTPYQTIPKENLAPAYTAPKPQAAPTPAPAPTVQAYTAPAPAPAAAPPAPNLDDLLNKYYGQSSNDVNSVYDQQKNSQLSQLKAQREAAIGKINQQQGQTKQEYYDKRNQADVVNAQNVQRLREILAANGVSASGDNLTLNARANSDRMNSLNSLNNQEQSQMNTYNNQIADWNNPAKDQAITSQIEAARAQALMSAKQAAYQKAWNDYQFNNMSASQQAQLAMGKYNTDSTNAANSASSQAALDYYNNMGFNGGSGGGGTADFNSNMSAAVQKGIPASWVPAMTEIVRRESSFNPSARNPSSGTLGYAQFQPYNITSYNQKYGLNYANNPVDQLVAMYHYISDRYGNANNALNFWNKNQWY